VRPWINEHEQRRDEKAERRQLRPRSSRARTSSQ
jgi:hypothetical protein